MRRKTINSTFPNSASTTEQSELGKIIEKQLAAEKEAAEIFNELKEYKSKHAVKRMMNILNVVLYIAIAGALLPQIAYYFYIFFINPDFQLPWRIRDSFLLFSAIGNLAVVVLTASSIIIVRTLGKRLDRYDQIIDAGMKDLYIVRSKFKAIGKDIDDIYPGLDKLTKFYKENDKNIHDGIDMLKHLMPLIPVIKKKYDKRLKKIKDLDDEDKEFVVDELLDEVFNRGD